MKVRDDGNRDIESAEEAIAKGTESLTQALLRASQMAHEARRRLALLLAAVFLVSVFVAIQLHDLHVKNCMVAGQPSGEAKAKLCDTFFFTHDHPVGGWR